jgi:hypothetical protein
VPKIQEIELNSRTVNPKSDSKPSEPEEKQHKIKKGKKLRKGAV